jgi:predicted transcriptional regulator YheO
MKKYFIITAIAFLALNLHARETTTALLPADTMQKIDAFSKKKLNKKTDLEEVKKILNTLLALDEEDPSRTAVMVLSQSYNKNKSLYDKAFKSIETKKNRQQLKEIKRIMANFYKYGNG